MNLIRATRDQIDWLISFSRKLRKLTPWDALLGISAFLLGQLFFVLAFFLPLKVILLLATEGVPWYLAGFLTSESKDPFIFLLAIGAIASYGLYLLFESIISKAVRRGSRRIVEKSNKLQLFSSQEDFARDVYLRYCRALASAILVVLGFALGAFLNALLFALLALLAIGEFAVLHMLIKRPTPLSEALSDVFRLKQVIAFNFLSSTNFLVGFGLLFGQFLASEQRNVIIAILSILLLRQIMNRLSVGIQDLIYFATNRLKINALFYAAIPYIPPRDKRQDAFMASFIAPARHEWLQQALSQVLAQPIRIARSTWLDSGTPGVACLEIQAERYPVSESEPSDPIATGPLCGTSQSHYFVKCFHATQHQFANHEITLFTSASKRIPCAPAFLGQIHVGDTKVVVFRSLPPNKPNPRTWKITQLRLQQEISSTEMNNELTKSYLRTHPTLTARLTPSKLTTIWPAVASDAQAQSLQHLIENWTTLCAQIDTLSVVLKNPDLNPELCRVGPAGEIVLWSWGKWCIDVPGGPAFLSPTFEKLNQRNHSWTSDQLGHRSANFTDALMNASRLYALERALIQNKLSLAVTLVVEIHSTFNSREGAMPPTCIRWSAQRAQRLT